MIPGSFPSSASSHTNTNSTPPLTLSPPTSLSSLSPSSSHRDLPSSPAPIHASRSSSRSGVQSRRLTNSLGLGVSFALPPFSPSPSGSRSRAPSLASQSRSHSRHSSISTNSGWSMSTGGESDIPFPLSPNSTTSLQLASPSLDSNGVPTPTTSRHPSRRPSLTHLASFLSGIEHHTRVRSPGINGGRGVSRSASRSGSRVGLDRLKSRDRDSSSRRSSIRLEPQTSQPFWRTHDEWGETEEEEPFLDSAPNSPPGHNRGNRNFSDSEDESEDDRDHQGSGLEGVDVFEEGERVGVG
ncbi:hypothetical protein P7C70_g5483, partial [Phenoliferia sp. Uapishka_3]